MSAPTFSKSGRAPGRSGGPAFTLVELLAVLAVIGLLAAILFAVISRVRESALLATCLGRERELGRAFQLHVNDQRGWLPRPRPIPQGRWPFHVAPYLGPWRIVYDEEGQVAGVTPDKGFYETPVFRDPANYFISTNAAAGTFACNAVLEERRVRWAELSIPGNFPVLATSQADVGGGLQLAGAGPSPKATTLGYKGATHISGPAPNYGRKAVFLFADWHVEARDVCDPTAWPWSDPQAFAVR